MSPKNLELASARQSATPPATKFDHAFVQPPAPSPLSPRLCALWIGEQLTYLERACLRSMLLQGHEVALYTYGQVDGVPDGIEIGDAAEILPEDRIIRHHTGSVALFSNHFRYELMRRGLGTWVDADTYLLRPLPGDMPYLFGRCDIGIATGVMRLPPDSPLLRPLLRLFRQKSVPSWMSWRERVKAHLRLLSTGSTDLSKMPWGVAGPIAFTLLARRYRLDALALPNEILYPWTAAEALWVTDPERKLDDWVTPETIAFHLYNAILSRRDIKEKPAPRASFLAQLQREGE